MPKKATSVIELDGIAHPIIGASGTISGLTTGTSATVGSLTAAIGLRSIPSFPIIAGNSGTTGVSITGSSEWSNDGRVQDAFDSRNPLYQENARLRQANVQWFDLLENEKQTSSGLRAENQILQERIARLTARIKELNDDWI